jgi:hypothetical protein
MAVGTFQKSPRPRKERGKQIFLFSKNCYAVQGREKKNKSLGGTRHVVSAKVCPI